MPDRKNDIVALTSWATLRKCENSCLLSSPAPSQEKTTNCGGRWPGSRRWGAGWFGCGPVSAIDPSPIRLTGDALGEPDTPPTGCPSPPAVLVPPPERPQADTPSAAAVAIAPPASTFLRDNAPMLRSCLSRCSIWIFS